MKNKHSSTSRQLSQFRPAKIDIRLFVRCLMRNGCHENYRFHYLRTNGFRWLKFQMLEHKKTVLRISHESHWNNLNFIFIIFVLFFFPNLFNKGIHFWFKFTKLTMVLLLWFLSYLLEEKKRFITLITCHLSSFLHPFLVLLLMPNLDKWHSLDVLFHHSYFFSANT